jgi:hypothetical protein
MPSNAVASLTPSLQVKTDRDAAVGTDESKQQIDNQQSEGDAISSANETSKEPPQSPG